MPIWPSSPAMACLVLMTLAVAGTVFHRQRWVRWGVMTAIVVLSLLPGFAGRWVWPFFSWHLYAFEAPTEMVYYDIRVADADGDEWRYDARAASPTLATPIRRFAQKLPDKNPDEARALAAFLLDRAEGYRQRVLSGDANYNWFKFPPHQIGIAWDRQSLKEADAFESLRVYRIEAEITSDGRQVLREEAERVWDYERVN